MKAVTEIIGKMNKDASYIIRALQAVQAEEGYVSDEAISAIAAHFDVSEAEIEGVLSFYAQFKRTKPGKYVIAVCDGTACHIKGSNLIENWITDELKIKDGETDETGTFSLELVACLGCCSLAPVIAINGKVYGKLDRKELIKILKKYQKGEV
jgi:NADH:ubiquinone oxidoreductase subunit E